ncbi:SBF-like CPA transporter family-domain-containing protein [Dioszegia hungarica]|uniref:SBF-like CPA transporter family-domain-containing protein n=1 Tax=Dioszegia hungarica TaxID=4972 RepID=A0AA38HEV4_9TREE|nr:SBF-like CPA transporter family-domain-containing protein [Dioszegia hungarica]KAI9639125.1 SBF-like CPA transporter family-domain-containing protein [Dioszegia hungarica]
MSDLSSPTAPATPIPIPTHPSTPSPSSASLSTLPQELLEQIVLELDLPSALALARVSSLFTPIADHRIWRDLNLSVEEGTTRLAERDCRACADHGRYHASGCDLWAKVDSVLGRGNTKRWAMVRDVTVVPLSGTGGAIAHLLEEVSPYLQSLTVLKNTFRVPYLDIGLLHHRRIIRERNVELSFPALTHLTLDYGTFEMAEFVYLLSEIAPNLVSLKLSFDLEAYEWPSSEGGSDEDEDELEEINAPYPRSGVRLRKLRWLSVSWYGDVELPPAGPVAFNPIRWLIKQSDRLQILYLWYFDDQHSFDSSIFSDLHELSELRELYLPGWFEHTAALRTTRMSEQEMMLAVEKQAKPSLPDSVERLAIPYGTWLHSTTPIASLPIARGVKTVIICTDYSSEPISIGPMAINPEFAAWLRAAPHLDDIYFACCDNPLWIAAETIPVHALAGIDHGRPIGTVWSLRYLGQELLHLRFLAEPCDSRRFYLPSASGDTSELSWHDYTDFRGQVIPMEVLERMRRHAGLETEGWERRGVDNGCTGSHKIPYFHLGKVDEHQSSHVTSLRNSQRLEIGLYTFERAVHIPSYQTITFGNVRRRAPDFSSDLDSTLDHHLSIYSPFSLCSGLVSCRSSRRNKKDVHDMVQSVPVEAAPLWRRALSVTLDSWALCLNGIAVGLAWRWPDVARGGGIIHSEYSVQYGVICSIFLITGLTLSIPALWNQARNYRLHLITQFISLIVYPAVTFALLNIIQAAGNAEIDIYILIGVQFVGCACTSIASNISVTIASGGNGEAATVEVVLGNLLCVLFSPLLNQMYFSASGWDRGIPIGEDGSSGLAGLGEMYRKVMMKMGLAMLLPFTTGLAVQYYFPKAVKAAGQALHLQKVSSILLATIVWALFSTQFHNDAFSSLPSASIYLLVFLIIIFYLGFSAVGFCVSRQTFIPARLDSRIIRAVRRYKLSKGETTAVCYCAATKGLAVGTPMLDALYGGFAARERAIISIPFGLYQLEQLVMAQLLRHVFKRWNARPEPVLSMDEVPSQIVGHHELLEREGSMIEEDVDKNRVFLPRLHFRPLRSRSTPPHPALLLLDFSMLQATLSPRPIRQRAIRLGRLLEMLPVHGPEGRGEEQICLAMGHEGQGFGAADTCGLQSSGTLGRLHRLLLAGST